MPFDTLTDVNGTVQSETAQRTAFKSFIEQDKYLKSRRGYYTEKYGAESPWFSQVELRLLQDFNFKINSKVDTLQLNLDFINIGNMLCSKWGVRKYASASGYFQPISYSKWQIPV
ncbi:hypothetical protein QWZ08_13770 [Ferruginibacter paludis]|uniref:hypothetical protein n=1 Tax=Ferruginibacter paludis TaxID=1310417 RepID=UPI0025B545A3|nr:hypothetical protein [Ferruginibacter paludis]MDN3656708.1 hypothetical protein [Ferruginibacter paludis]